MRSIKTYLLVSIALSLSGSAETGAEILDPCGDHVLLEMAGSLDAAGVDVIMGRASEFEVSERPRLARLNGFVGHEKNWGETAQGAWASAFEAGVAGAVIALKAQENQLPATITHYMEQCRGIDRLGIEITCEFLEKWLNTSPENRVFVAFTRSDRQLAEKVRTLLERRGYVAFTYLRENDQDPWADPAFVGEVFAASSQRYVLDTRNSRGSEGVQFEAHCCSWIFSSSEPQTEDAWRRILRSTDP